MEELYKIMGDLSEIAFNIESLRYLLKSLGEYYQYKQEYELQNNIIIFQILMDSFSDNLSNKIDEIDRFILVNKKDVTSL